MAAGFGLKRKKKINPVNSNNIKNKTTECFKSSVRITKSKKMLQGETQPPTVSEVDGGF